MHHFFYTHRGRMAIVAEILTKKGMFILISVTLYSYKKYEMRDVAVGRRTERNSCVLWYRCRLSVAGETDARVVDGQALVDRRTASVASGCRARQVAGHVVGAGRCRHDGRLLAPALEQPDEDSLERPVEHRVDERVDGGRDVAEPEASGDEPLGDVLGARRPHRHQQVEEEKRRPAQHEPTRVRGKNKDGRYRTTSH